LFLLALPFFFLLFFFLPVWCPLSCLFSGEKSRTRGRLFFFFSSFPPPPSFFRRVARPQMRDVERLARVSFFFPFSLFPLFLFSPPIGIAHAGKPSRALLSTNGNVERSSPFFPFPLFFPPLLMRQIDARCL